MQFSIERLRVWLLVGGSLLVLVIAGFLGYAHYRAHAFLKGLPGRLGVDIKQETNGYTYSQSVGGKTVFTIHAAKAIQRKDGKVTLHDVGIVLYGRKQDRADRIYGSEFEYDQNTGVVRAMGEVHLDLEAPTVGEGRGAKGARVVRPEGQAKPVIHIKTSGLVYLQKLGVAATDEPIEFQSGGWTGRSKGADYSSDTGVLVLHSDVKLTGLAGARPVVITGARAAMDRQSQRVVLTGARGVSLEDSMRADQAIVHLRADGSPERIEAAGGVVLTGEGRGTLTGARADMTLDEQSRARSSRLSGGLRYVDDEARRQARGQASEAVVRFDGEGRAEHVTLSGGVRMDERVRGVEDAWSTREMEAGRVELGLAASGVDKSRLQTAEGVGSARVVMVSPGQVRAGQAKGNAPSGSGRSTATRTEIAGDDLRAEFVEVGMAVRVSAINAVGNTVLRRVADVVDESSSGDRVQVRFVTGSGPGGGKSAVGFSKGRAAGRAVAGVAAAAGEQVASAAQQGHVRMTRTRALKAGVAGSGEEHATAEQAEFDGAADRLTLTGSVQINSDGEALSAGRVVMDQATGDAWANGGVKGSYVQTGVGATAGDGASVHNAGRQLEPMHVLAERAELKHAAQTAIFYGAEGKGGQLARMWQGGSQVEAPVLEFHQKERRVVARGEGGTGGGSGSGIGGVVHTALVGSGMGQAGAHQPAVLRVASREMTYSDGQRQADFTGGVKVQDADGTMLAQTASAYLVAAGGSAGVVGDGKGAVVAAKVAADRTGMVASGLLGGSVERVVATGKIEIQQPGRRATGEQVVYTAKDRMFVLTGTPAVPPRLVDEQRGTVTGTSLRFHSGDDSVLVSGGTPGVEGGGQRVHTETRVKQK